ACGGDAVRGGVVAVDCDLMNDRIRLRLILRLTGILLLGLGIPGTFVGVWDAAWAVNWHAIQSRVIFDIISGIAGQLTLSTASRWIAWHGVAIAASIIGLYLLLGGT